jgi:hypothetical protein
VKLAYIILSLVFLLTSIYGLEKFIASRRNVNVLVKMQDKQGAKRAQVKS